MHVLIDVSAGIALEDSGATRFFVTQILGLFVETILITIYWRIHGSEKILGTWEKAVGFIWVSAFLVWSSPSYLYAQMWRTNAGLNDSIIPYSFFDVEEMHHAMLCVGLVIFFTLQANFLRQNGKN
jgi:hypothetical protein